MEKTTRGINNRALSKGRRGGFQGSRSAGMKNAVGDGSLRSISQYRKANAKEWRLFMSPRVANTLSSSTAPRSAHMDNEKKLQKEEHDKIFKQVEQLGTSQISWKKRKEIELQKRVALGAKPEKGHRMSIRMGMNMKRKRERVEEQSLQDEMVLAGFRAAKRGKRTTEKPTASDRGLKASEGVFKGGVLYVKPPATKAEENNSQAIGRGKGKSLRKGKKSKQKGKRRKRR